MTENVSKTDRKLSRTGTVPTLQGIVGESEDTDLDIFGYQIIYTTGDFLVDRAAFVEKAEELGIAEWMLPAKVKPHYAYGRMLDDLLEGREEIRWGADPNDPDDDGQRVQFDLRRNDSNYSYTLQASTYYPPEMTNDNEGKWMGQDLGVIRYDSDSSSLSFIDRIEDDEALYPVWADDVNGFRARAEQLFERHQESHTGKDVNNMTYYLVDYWTDSIRLRDACYFVPATHTYRIDGEQRPIEDLIDGFQALYSWLNRQAFDPDSDVVEKPDGAQKTEMHTIEIMDTDRQREMVESKVREQTEAVARDLAHDVLDRLAEDDVVAEQVAGEVGATLENLRAKVAGYDEILGSASAEAKLDNAVRRAVEKALDDLDDDEAELVEAVLDEADAEPAEAAA